MLYLKTITLTYLNYTAQSNTYKKQSSFNTFSFRTANIQTCFTTAKLFVVKISFRVRKQFLF